MSAGINIKMLVYPLPRTAILVRETPSQIVRTVLVHRCHRLPARRQNGQEGQREIQKSRENKGGNRKEVEGEGEEIQSAPETSEEVLIGA